MHYITYAAENLLLNKPRKCKSVTVALKRKTVQTFSTDLWFNNYMLHQKWK